MDTHLLAGRVIRSHGSHYYVQTEEGRIFPCRLRGKFRIQGDLVSNPVAVGDEVQISFWRDEGTIEEILPRRNKLSRLAPGQRATELEHIIVANLDQVVLVVSTRQPRLKTNLIDRFLMATENQGLPAVICINKIDLAKPKEYESAAEIYQSIGYPVFLTCAKSGQGVDVFKDVIIGKMSVFTGHSGVGKTSLLNMIETGLGLRVGKVSRKTNKGRHTTVHTELVPISSGGWVADTPGFREFGLLSMEPEDLTHLFPEFESYLGECRFHNCQHLAEPGCAIKAAVDEGDIYESRYDSYCTIHGEMAEKTRY